MAIRTLVFSALVLLLAVGSGCVAGFQSPTRPAEVSHMDIARKQDYIRTTKATLKTFQRSARDLRDRNRPLVLQELSDEVHRYIRLQVDPIVNDFEAGNNLETRLEIGKLQLLSGLVYVELGETGKVRRLLREMNRRYSTHSSLLTTAIDRNDIGFSSLEEGMQALRERLATDISPLPAANPMMTPRG